MKSNNQVEDKTIIGIPNNIFKYNAGGFQLIKLEEIQTIWPFTALGGAKRRGDFF